MQVRRTYTGHTSRLDDKDQACRNRTAKSDRKGLYIDGLIIGQITSATPIDPRKVHPYTSPPSCPGGGIGRRGGFKIRFRKEWEFESPPGHHDIRSP